MAESRCGRCASTVDEHASPCWYCDAPLCAGCHDSVGHCGHPEAVALNEASRNWKPGDPPLPRPWSRSEVAAWYLDPSKRSTL